MSLFEVHSSLVERAGVVTWTLAELIRCLLDGKKGRFEFYWVSSDAIFFYLGVELSSQRSSRLAALRFPRRTSWGWGWCWWLLTLLASEKQDSIADSISAIVWLSSEWIWGSCERVDIILFSFLSSSWGPFERHPLSVCGFSLWRSQSGYSWSLLVMSTSPPPVWWFMFRSSKEPTVGKEVFLWRLCGEGYSGCESAGESLFKIGGSQHISVSVLSRLEPTLEWESS